MTTLDWKHEAIEQLEFHWSHQLRPRLEGLTDDEYFWEPVAGCWTVHAREEERTRMQVGKGAMVLDFEYPEPVPAPVTTIAWRIAHVAAGIFHSRAANHFGEGMTEPWWDQFDWPATAQGALEWLDDGYSRWSKGLKSLDDDMMARAVGPAEGPYADYPFAALILHINREAIHHGAEIALLRDLYAHRS
jgi:hypothetical protein